MEPNANAVGYRSRALEWAFAITTAGFGVWMLAPWEAMDAPSLSWLREFAAEIWWGWFFLMAGAQHVLALLINGHRWWTPFVRLTVLILSLAAYALFAIGIAWVNPGVTGTYTYSALASMALFCIYRAGKDARHSLEIRRAGLG